jgi:hypothetical protein
MIDTLPTQTIFDHAINLHKGKDPFWGAMYVPSAIQPKVYHKYLDEILKIGKIELSKSLVRVLILFIPQAYWRGCFVDFTNQRLNIITILNQYALLLFNKLKDWE